MILVSSCSCLCPIHWSHVSSWEWRCSWSSADRRCSNYIWVIKIFIAFSSASYIRGFTVYMPQGNDEPIILYRNINETSVTNLTMLPKTVASQESWSFHKLNCFSDGNRVEGNNKVMTRYRLYCLFVRGSCRLQIGSMLAPWTPLSGQWFPA